MQCRKGRLAPEAGAGAGERVVLTEEQARELEEKHQLKALTPRAKSGTMRLADSDDFWHPITEHAVQSIPQVSAFSGDLNTVVQQQCREMMRYIRTRIDHPDSDETLEEFVKGSERYGTKYHK